MMDSNDTDKEEEEITQRRNNSTNNNNNNNNSSSSDSTRNTLTSSGSTKFPSIIELNVGGKYFTTSLTTLTTDPNSMLSRMFSGNLMVAKDSNGRYFIDRDGKYFNILLNYLRDNEIILPDEFKNLRQLKREAQFFQLQGVLDAIGIEEEKRASQRKKRITFEYKHVCSDMGPEWEETVQKATKGGWEIVQQQEYEGRPTYCSIVLKRRVLELEHP